MGNLSSTQDKIAAQINGEDEEAVIEGMQSFVGILRQPERLAKMRWGPPLKAMQKILSTASPPSKKKAVCEGLVSLADVVSDMQAGSQSEQATAFQQT